jgi:hypothetical protein
MIDSWPRLRRAALIAGALAALALLTACTSSTRGAGTDTGSATAALPRSTASTATPSPTPTTAVSSSTPSPISSSSAATASPGGGPVPAGFIPSSATFISASQGWVLGTAPCTSAPCTSIVRTVDGTRSWVGIPAPKAALSRTDNATSSTVSILRFATSSDGWAAGGALYSTHNGGQSWQPVRLGPAGSTVTALESGGGYVYAAVDECPLTSGCNATSAVFASPIGADQFRAVGATFRGLIEPAGLAVHGPDWFAAPVPGTRIYHGHALSAPASMAEPCATDFGPAAIAAADAQHLDLLCGGDGAAGSATYQLYGTVSGGTHWSPSGPAHRQLPSGVSAMSDNGSGALLIAAESGNSQLLRTTNDGTSLSTVLTLSSGGQVWGDAGYTTASQAFAVLGGTGCYLSRDAGSTWTKIIF